MRYKYRCIEKWLIIYIYKGGFVWKQLTYLYPSWLRRHGNLVILPFWSWGLSKAFCLALKVFSHFFFISSGSPPSSKYFRSFVTESGCSDAKIIINYILPHFFTKKKSVLKNSYKTYPTVLAIETVRTLMGGALAAEVLLCTAHICYKVSL